MLEDRFSRTDEGGSGVEWWERLSGWVGGRHGWLNAGKPGEDLIAAEGAEEFVVVMNQLEASKQETVSLLKTA